jgi:hypothetical protein
MRYISLLDLCASEKVKRLAKISGEIGVTEMCVFCKEQP